MISEEKRNILVYLLEVVKYIGNIVD